MQSEISWNYTTWLNIAFLVIAALLVCEFFTSGGLEMARMMGGDPPEAGDDQSHHTSERSGTTRSVKTSRGVGHGAEPVRGSRFGD